MTRFRPYTMSAILLVFFVDLVGCGKDTKTATPTAPTSVETKSYIESHPEAMAEQAELDARQERRESRRDATVATTSRETDAGDVDRVLRHAVFFSFKESSSEEDIQKIVDAFVALPTKIPEIVDFQWGVNNSPEGLDDGFTHCFLLTFKDEAGREVYLPHDDHKAFGKVLGSHNDKVFVIDYWGKANDAKIDKELKHAVFFKFKDDASAEDVREIEQAFAALPSKIDTIKGFEWGVNNSPERHSGGFTHCFMVTFDSEEGRAAYLPHADHQAFVEILKPVLDKVRVLDFWDQTD